LAEQNEEERLAKLSSSLSDAALNLAGRTGSLGELELALEEGITLEHAEDTCANPNGSTGDELKCDNYTVLFHESVGGMMALCIRIETHINDQLVSKTEPTRLVECSHALRLKAFEKLTKLLESFERLSTARADGIAKTSPNAGAPVGRKKEAYALFKEMALQQELRSKP
jgi:hypothetical protein